MAEPIALEQDAVTLGHEDAGDEVRFEVAIERVCLAFHLILHRREVRRFEAQRQEIAAVVDGSGVVDGIEVAKADDALFLGPEQGGRLGVGKCLGCRRVRHTEPRHRQRDKHSRQCRSSKRTSHGALLKSESGKSLAL